MKCDHCVSFFAFPAQRGQPYPETGCLLGHWEGFGEGPEPEDLPDPWADCVDFNESRLINCGSCVDLARAPALNSIIYSCRRTGYIIPQQTEIVPGIDGKQITDFLRVPMSCPRPDSEVIKKPYGG